MTEKELVLYIRRITDHLQTIYEQISNTLPNAERVESTRKQLKPEIKEQVDEWKKDHLLSAASFLGNIPKEFDLPENFETVVEFGGIKVLEPLKDMIDNLESDIDILIPAEK